MKHQLYIPSVIIGSIVLCALSFCSHAQSILGSWQLIRQTTCAEDNLPTIESDSIQDLLNDMKGMGMPAPQVVKFKEKGSGEESTKILNRKKSANSKNFLYKFDGEMLLLLDKKSQTITDSYEVNKFSSDSLIVSNYARPCETKIFLKIRESN
jgi:hypothetical protein